MTGEQTQKKHLWLYGLITLSAIAVWLLHYSLTSYNFNVIWLGTCADRILNGGSMSAVCFETNPPLSIILYMPVTILKNLTGIAEHLIFPAYVSAVITLAALLFFKLLQKLSFFDKEQALFIALLFLIANTVLTGRQFGERDHFVFIGLFLVILNQYIITERIYVSKVLQGTSLFLGSVLILIKPHYLLIIAAFIIFRSYQWKKPQALFQNDALIISATTVLYALLLWAFFNDYLFEILPLAKTLYADSIFLGTYLIPVAACLLALLLCWGEAMHQLYKDKAARPLFHYIFLAASLSLLIIVLQKKGWVYHYIPFYGLVFIGTFGAIALGKHCKTTMRKLLLLLASIIVALSLAWIPFQAPNHHDYKNYNLAKILRDYKTNSPDAKCKFMMFGDMHEMQSLAYYNDCELASRFAVVWFQKAMQNYEQTKESEKEPYLTQIKLFADMYGEDLNRYEPPILIVKDWPNVDQENTIDIMSHASEKFQSAWNNYKLNETLLNESPYYFEGGNFAERPRGSVYRLYHRNP